eukprot:385894-Pelagomonas_calceolata.AAC.1
MGTRMTGATMMGSVHRSHATRTHRGAHVVSRVDDTDAGQPKVCQLDVAAVVDEHVVRLRKQGCAFGNIDSFLHIGQHLAPCRLKCAVVQSATLFPRQIHQFTFIHS